MRPLLFALFLSGCAHDLVWRKHGATGAELRADSYECERDARVVSQPRHRWGSASVEVDEDFFEECMAAREWQHVKRGTP